MDEAKRGMQKVLRANALDVNEQYEGQINGLQEARSEAGLKRQVRKNCSPVGQGREIIETIRRGLKKNEFIVSIFKLCLRFNIPRPTVYCERIKAMIEQSPFFGCRTGAI